MRLKYYLVLAAQLVWLFSLSAQSHMGWKQFLLRENPNFYTICSEAERYFEEQKTQTQRKEETDANEGEGSAYNQFQRWKWFWSTRVNPDGSLPDLPATAFFRDSPGHPSGVTDRSGGPASCGWELISQNTCTGGYHGMGRTTSIAFHPSNANIYYVGAPNGGIWKTTDGGDSYTSISEGLPYNGGSNLMVDYQNPQVLYLSNGDHVGWWTYSTGIYKSTDGGNTWFPTSLNWPLSQGVAVLSAAMDPQNPAVLLVATSIGLYRSDDSGGAWTKVRDGFYSDVKFRPGDGSTAYAALHDYWGTSQIFKSVNGGLDWAQLSDFSASQNWIRLSVTPANPSLLAAVCNYGDNRQFYISTTNGADLSYRSECPESTILFASPNDPNTLYCGYVNIYRSTDQGQTWEQFTNWFGGTAQPEVHADVHYAAAQPGTSRVFFCNDGGVYRYDENTKTWLERSNGLIITQFYRIAVAQTDEIFMIGGTQDNGGRKRVGLGEWEATNGGDGMEVAIDYTNPDILYTTYINGQLYRSMDGWNGDAVRISDNLPGQTPNHDLSGAWVAPYQIDPVNPAALVLGYAEVYRTTNRGNTWTQISDGLTGGQTLEALVIAPSNPNVILAARSNKLYKTTNLGANWSTYTVPGSAPITSITVHPWDPNIIYLTRGSYNAGSKVFRSTNGGGTWVNISGNLPNVSTNTLYLDVAPDSSYTLFVGNDLGVWYRRSTMNNWVGMNQNLPVTVVSDLELQKSSRRLRAGTFGRGIWEYDLGHLPAAGFAVCTEENQARICLPQSYTATLSADAWQNLGGSIQLSLSTLPAGVTATWSAQSIDPGSTSTVTFDLPAGLPEGEYPVTVFAVAAGDTATATLRLRLVSNDFSALSLQQPAFGASGVSRFPLLRWQGVVDANQYELELATNPSFEATVLVKSYTGLKADSLQWNLVLDEGQVYYWRVRPLNECGAGAWVGPFVFATASKNCVTLVSNDVPKVISSNGTPTV
ncbi:MAG: hypothetical protein IT260_23955, partial [Saprospiraceae bacterium]|nr:hypothetical protein [Saprospiraceae bacterium]